MIKVEDWEIKIGKFHISLFDDESFWVNLRDLNEKGIQIKEKDFEDILNKLYEQKSRVK